MNDWSKMESTPQTEYEDEQHYRCDGLAAAALRLFSFRRCIREMSNAYVHMLAALFEPTSRELFSRRVRFSLREARRVQLDETRLLPDGFFMIQVSYGRHSTMIPPSASGHRRLRWNTAQSTQKHALYVPPQSELFLKRKMLTDVLVGSRSRDHFITHVCGLMRSVISHFTAIDLSYQKWQSTTWPCHHKQTKYVIQYDGVIVSLLLIPWCQLLVHTSWLITEWLWIQGDASSVLTTWQDGRNYLSDRDKQDWSWSLTNVLGYVGLLGSCVFEEETRTRFWKGGGRSWVPKANSASDLRSFCWD